MRELLPWSGRLPYVFEKKAALASLQSILIQGVVGVKAGYPRLNRLLPAGTLCNGMRSSGGRDRILLEQEI